QCTSGWPSWSLDTKAHPIAPPRMRMSSHVTWFDISRLCPLTGAPRMVTRAPTIHAAAPRKRGGHGERPVSFLDSRWIGASIANSPSNPAIRRAARMFRPTLAPSAVAAERDAVQFHAVVDEPEAELLGNALLQHLEF